MIRRSILFAALLPLSALAQLQVFVVNGGTETSAGALLNVGTASPGDTITTRFAVRNLGASGVVLDQGSLALSGSGFAISPDPSLPYTIPPYTGSPVSEFQFSVVFSPTDVLVYNAFLMVNTINIILQGTGAPSAVLTLSGSDTPLAAGSIIDFGSHASKTSNPLTFNLSNPGSASITVGVLSVNGAGFTGPFGDTAPITLQPGQTQSFSVKFQPASGQAYQGTLLVDQRSFTLTGQGLNPPLPGASIVFGASVGHSAQQNNVSITLASASQVSGVGTLTMTFQPSVQGVTDDPAIQFLSGPTRHATVTISPGDTTAKFDGGQSDLAFQTGTTAGAITFTLTLNAAATPAAQSTLNIASAPVNFETATSVRRLGALDVSITAFDNTYSASQLAFTFYDKKNAPLQPGTISVDAGGDFRSYFATSQTGGAFGLLATFPVSGDTSQIISVDVQVTNSQGVAAAQRITIGN